MRNEFHPGSKKILINLLIKLRDNGSDLSEICGRSKISFDKFLSGENGISGIDAECIWETSVELTKDKNLGFNMGQNLDISTLGIYGMILQKSPNLIEVFQNASRFLFLITDILAMETRIKDNEFIIKFTPIGVNQHLYKHRLEQSCMVTLGFIFKIYENLSFKKPNLSKIILPNTNIDYSQVEAFTDKPIVVEKTSSYTLVFNKSDLEQTLMDYDLEILQTLIEKVNNQTDVIDNKWTKKIRAKLLDAQNKFFSLEHIAADLQLSTRSLQRKLKEENTSFKEICEAAKCDLAKYYMYDNANVKQIASRLGYANVSSFNRAFSVWTGMTIQEYYKVKKTQLSEL